VSTTLCQADLSGNTAATNLNAYTPQAGDVAAVFTRESASVGNFVQDAATTAFYQAFGSTADVSFYTCTTAAPGSGVGVLTVGINVFKITNVAFNQNGVILGWTDANNYLLLLTYWDGSATKLILQKWVGGVSTDLATVTVTFGTGTDRRVEVDYDTTTDNAKLYFYDPSGGRAQVGTGGGYSVSGVTVLGKKVGVYTAVFGTSDGSTAGQVAAQYKAAYSGTATAYTLTGPSRGPAGAASSDFTVTLNGPPGGTIVVTFHDAGGGTFTPSTLSFSGGTIAGTTRLNRAGNSTANVTGTNNGGLTDPGAVAYTTTTATTGNYSFQDGAPTTATTYQVFNADNTAWQPSGSAGTSNAAGGGAVAGVSVPADYAGFIKFTQGTAVAADVLTPPLGISNIFRGVVG